MKRKNNKKRKPIKMQKIIILIISVILVFALFNVIFYQGLEVTSYTLSSEKVSTDIRICLLSDLHSSLYGNKQKTLLSAIDNAKPDLILITGDLFDENKKSTENVEDLLSEIGEKYTCFYVTGNHEFYTEKSEEYKALVRSYSITVLEGDSIPVTVDGQKIHICGVNDFRSYEQKYSNPGEAFENDIKALAESIDKDEFSVFLYHRPSHSNIIAEEGFDIIFSGHNHGGQVRIPFLTEGLYTPSEGFFPEYPGGIYSVKASTLVVSRGLCKNLLPRVFNRPELVVLDIKPN